LRDRGDLHSLVYRVFSNSPASDDQWAYTIFSESHGTIDGNPQFNNDPNKLDAIPYNDNNSTKKLNIGNAYGIKNVIFTNCDNTAKAIAFDYMGRPMDGNILALCKKNNSCEDNVTIVIEPQTGYVHQLK